MGMDGMVSVNQTRPHCVYQMGKTHYQPLAARHGRGTAWAWHWNGMLCVNQSIVSLWRPKCCECEERTASLWELRE